MALFNKKIDYNGQDLHILRNNQDFPLHLFFDSTADLSYEFRLDRIYIDEDVSYEKIAILITHDSNNDIDTVCINAEPYVTGNGVRVDNFFAMVTNNTPREVATILVHLHNQIDQVWTSPDTLSLRRGMALKFGVLASFTDGDYADLSFYPEMKKNLTNGTSYLSIPPDSSGDDPRRITWKADPPNNNPIIDAITIELPIWMENSGSSNRIQVKGNIKVLDEFGTLNFHNGDITDVNERVNILFLCDGFDGSDDADLSTFHEIINEHNKQMLMKRSYAPWNLLSNKVNTWSYYTQDTNKYSSLESEYIFVKNDSVTTTPTVAELYRFLYFFDNIIMFYLTSTLTQTVDDFIEERKSEFSPALIDFLDFKSSNLASQFPLISQLDILT